MKATCLAALAIFCLAIGALVVNPAHALAQAPEPNPCDGSQEAICGFPVDGNPTQMTGRAVIHDSCIPEGSCPWIQGIDIWWPGNPNSTERPTNLISVLNGVVATAGHIDRAGNPVIAIKNRYFLCYYLHADAVYVTVGEQVNIGTALGLMGIQGRTSKTTHVHFSCKRNSTGTLGISLRLNELGPLLKGWPPYEGTQPQGNSDQVNPPAEEPMAISINDLPYAEANQVVYELPYTPTVEVTATPTSMVIPTSQATAEPMTTTQSGKPLNNEMVLVVLVILVLAFALAPKTRGINIPKVSILLVFLAIVATWIWLETLSFSNKPMSNRQSLATPTNTPIVAATDLQDVQNIPINADLAVKGDIWLTPTPNSEPTLQMEIVDIGNKAEDKTNIQNSQTIQSEIWQSWPCLAKSGWPAAQMQWCQLFSHFAKKDVNGFVDINPDVLMGYSKFECPSGEPTCQNPTSAATGLCQVMPSGDPRSLKYTNKNGVPYFANRPTVEQLSDPVFNVEYCAKLVGGYIAAEGYNEKEGFRRLGHQYTNDPYHEVNIIRQNVITYAGYDPWP